MMGSGLYFMVGFGILDPARLRGTMSVETFWDETIEGLIADCQVETIVLRTAYETQPNFLAIAVAGTNDRYPQQVRVQTLGSEPKASRYVLPLAAWPRAVLLALGEQREVVETQWRRVQYLASVRNINLPAAEWLLVNDWD